MKKLFLSFAIVVSSTGYADTATGHTVVPNYTITTPQKLHTLHDVRQQKNRVVKPAKIREVSVKRSKTLHTLDYVRQQRRGVVKPAEMRQVSAKKSKTLHTLDMVRRLSRIAKIKEIKQIDKPKKVLAKVSKKSYTLKKIKLAKIIKRKPITRAKKTKIALRQKRVVHVQRKTNSKKLVKALQTYTKSIGEKRKIEKRITLSDIFFKSSRSHTLESKATKIINIAKTKLGKKYVWGAVGKSGTFDCSGFTSYVYKKNGIHIPRTSRNQAKYGKYVARNELKKGDLIFFDTSRHRKGYVNHVGIYLGDGKFIHASSAQKRVVVSSLSKFYAQRYVGARRPS